MATDFGVRIFDVNLGVGFDLTPSSDGFVVKTIVGYAFPVPGDDVADAGAETTFKAIRWADTNGPPVCPSCGSVEAYEARRPNGALRFRCERCKKDFTKLPLRGYLAAIAEERLGPQPRPRPVLQVRIRPAAQVA